MPEPFIGHESSSIPRTEVDRRPPGESIQLVRVVDVDIAFWTMVKLLVKVTFAAIPAGIMVFVIVAIFVVIAQTLDGALHR